MRRSLKIYSSLSFTSRTLRLRLTDSAQQRDVSCCCDPTANDSGFPQQLIAAIEMPPTIYSNHLELSPKW